MRRREWGGEVGGGRERSPVQWGEGSAAHDPRRRYGALDAAAVREVSEDRGLQLVMSNTVW